LITWLSVSTGFYFLCLCKHVTAFLINKCKKKKAEDIGIVFYLLSSIIMELFNICWVIYGSTLMYDNDVEICKDVTSNIKHFWRFSIALLAYG
jgi:hypothetical protein